MAPWGLTGMAHKWGITCAVWHLSMLLVRTRESFMSVHQASVWAIYWENELRQIYILRTDQQFTPATMWYRLFNVITEISASRVAYIPRREMSLISEESGHPSAISLSLSACPSRNAQWCQALIKCWHLTFRKRHALLFCPEQVTVLLRTSVDTKPIIPGGYLENMWKDIMLSVQKAAWSSVREFFTENTRHTEGRDRKSLLWRELPSSNRLPADHCHSV